jgi:hypothetical protein
LLLGDEIRHRLERLKLLVPCTWLLGLGRLSHEPSCPQIGERVSFVHRGKPGDAPATHRHNHLATLRGMLHVPTQLIVQLTDTNFLLQR